MLIFSGGSGGFRCSIILHLSGACDASTGGDHKGSAHPYGAGDDEKLAFSMKFGFRRKGRGSVECMEKNTWCIQLLENSLKKLFDVDGKGQ